MYGVVFFAEEYEERCPRGCCTDASYPSEFNIDYFDDYDEMVKAISKFVFPDRYCQVRVFRQLEDFEHYSKNEGKGTSAIHVPYHWDWRNDENYTESDPEFFEDQLKQDCQKELDKLKAELEEKEKQRIEKEEKDRIERMRSTELALLNKLKEKYNEA